MNRADRNVILFKLCTIYFRAATTIGYEFLRATAELIIINVEAIVQSSIENDNISCIT